MSGANIKTFDVNQDFDANNMKGNGCWFICDLKASKNNLPDYYGFLLIIKKEEVSCQLFLAASYHCIYMRYYWFGNWQTWLKL